MVSEEAAADILVLAFMAAKLSLLTLNLQARLLREGKARDDLEKYTASVEAELSRIAARYAAAADGGRGQ